LKKKVALLSSGEPANSSMLNGPLAVPLEPSALSTLRAGQQRGGLLDADLGVVEGGVVVHVSRR